MAVKYDVVATIGQYQAGGQTKYNTRKVGVILETSKGFALKMDCCFTAAGLKPDESGSVWLNLYPPKEHQQQQARNLQQEHFPQDSGQNPYQTQQRAPAQPQGGYPQPQHGAPAFDDDIPFMRIGREGDV